jgi:hypothetical protein
MSLSVVFFTAFVDGAGVPAYGGEESDQVKKTKVDHQDTSPAQPNSSR